MLKQADIDVDIRARLGKAATPSSMTSGSISNTIKFSLYFSIVLSTALHAYETWICTAHIRNTLDVFHRRCIQKIFGLNVASPHYPGGNYEKSSDA